MLTYQYNDGGRARYFSATNVGDCVCRAIAIANNADYLEAYNLINQITKKIDSRRCARNGVSHTGLMAIREYLSLNGWKWIACTKIGSGCKVKLDSNFPKQGTFIVRVSKHLTVVRDGVILDTHDCSRGGNRQVYGYFSKVNS